MRGTSFRVSIDLMFAEDCEVLRGNPGSPPTAMLVPIDAGRDAGPFESVAGHPDDLIIQMQAAQDVCCCCDNSGPHWDSSPHSGSGSHSSR